MPSFMASPVSPAAVLTRERESAIRSITPEVCDMDSPDSRILSRDAAA